MYKMSKIIVCKALIFIALTFMILPSQPVYARGNKDVITGTADGIDIRQKEFDVSGMKPGTYNIIVNAKDAAGNEGVSGPFNIRIDSMAGLPEARVVYPESGRVVREDINIVGVAGSRYGIKRILVKIDGEEYPPIEGSEYWNLHIPAMDMVDGKHIISVRAIDSQDLTGPEVHTGFTLDVTPPVIELAGHQIGDFIAGTVKIEGKVHDDNLIQSLSPSTDGREFRSLRLRNKRGDDSNYFQFTILSGRYEDGPLVYYLKAGNRTGNSVTRPFLFFVNNNPPQIEIITPTPEESAYGKIQVTGRVITGVGLTAFYYEWAGERVDIPLKAGDSFRSVSFPISMANNRSIPFRVTAVDKSGNVTTVTRRFQDVRQNRTPALVIDCPPPPSFLGSMNLAPDQPVYGHILPGFFPYAIIIEGQIEYIMAQPGFRIPPELIPEGRSTMRLRAIDADDVTGEPCTLRINKAPAPADFDAVESPLTINTVAGSFYDPFEYPWAGDMVTVNGFVDDYSGGQTVWYRYNWNDSWKQVDVDFEGGFSADISLAGFPEGPVPLEFRTVRNDKGDIPLYLPVNKSTAKPVITFLTPARDFGTIHGDVTTSGIIDYGVPLSRLSYSIDGVTFERLDFIARDGRAWFYGHFDYSALNLQGQQLVVRAVDQAGNTVEASPGFTFDNTTNTPVLILNAPLDGDLVTGNFEISGLAYDDDSLSRVYWRLLSPANPWDPVEETPASGRYNVEYERLETPRNFNIPLTIDYVLDGENILEIFAGDMYGVPGPLIRRVFRVNTAPPDVALTKPSIQNFRIPVDFSMITDGEYTVEIYASDPYGVHSETVSHVIKVSTAPPETEIRVLVITRYNQKSIMVQGFSADANGMANVALSMDSGNTWQNVALYTDGNWELALNTAIFTDGIYSALIRAGDRYGIATFSNAMINIDNTPPELYLGSPVDGQYVGSELPLTGRISDNTTLKSITVQMINSKDPFYQRTTDIDPNLVIFERINFGDFPQGDYIVRVVTVDLADNESLVSRKIVYNADDNTAQIAIFNPLPGEVHSVPVHVAGTVSGSFLPGEVQLMMDGKALALVPVDRYGVFRYEIPESLLAEEVSFKILVSYLSETGKTVISPEHTVYYSRFGPILLIDYLFGLDWSFYSMNFALGTNFSLFSMDEWRSPVYTGAVVGQWDIASIDMQYFYPKWKYFKNFALYLEPELWFASSGVRAETILRMTLGLRINCF